jgi:hypothetical protein
MRPNRGTYIFLALLGLFMIMVGTFLPVRIVTTDFSDGALFDLGNFDEMGFPENDSALRNGLSANAAGIILLLLVAIAVVPAVTLRGLGAMTMVIFFYLLTVFISYVGQNLDYAWFLLFGGVCLMVVAWLRMWAAERATAAVLDYYNQLQAAYEQGQYGQSYGQPQYGQGQYDPYGQPPGYDAGQYGQPPPYDPGQRPHDPYTPPPSDPGHYGRPPYGQG